MKPLPGDDRQAGCVVLGWRQRACRPPVNQAECQAAIQWQIIEWRQQQTCELCSDPARPEYGQLNRDAARQQLSTSETESEQHLRPLVDWLGRDVDRGTGGTQCCKGGRDVPKGPRVLFFPCHPTNGQYPFENIWVTQGPSYQAGWATLVMKYCRLYWAGLQNDQNSALGLPNYSLFEGNKMIPRLCAVMTRSLAET